MTEEEKMKLLYERYNKCRDLELDRFWKNSVFVWVFLALCFGAFGKVLMDYLEYDCKEHNIDNKDNYAIILAVVSCFGFLISKIWTWMARGLKAWYEVYEIAIWDIESKSNVLEFNRKYTIDNYWSLKQHKVIEFWKRPFDAARYSPSKIVILIGHLLSLGWFIAFGTSLCFYYGYEFMDYLVFGWIQNHPVKWICIFIVFVFAIVHLPQFFIKSSTLRNSNEEKVFQKIRSELIHTTDDNDDKKESLNLYFEVKDGKIKFFCLDDNDKQKVKEYVNDNLQKHSILKIWYKVFDPFKDDTIKVTKKVFL